MNATAWLQARAIELAASLCTAGVLIAGLAVGIPFLRARIPETLLYSVCCVAAVVLRAGIDLAVRGLSVAARGLHSQPIVIPALSGYPTGMVE
jgi:hypothetical protein